MKIGVVGTGYVGLTQLVCMASYLNHNFIGFDIDNDKINKLNEAIPTIYENSLEQLLRKDIESGNLKFTNHIDELTNCTIVFLAVGTPTNSTTGKQDLTYLQNAFTNVSNILDKNSKHVIVVKSTVLPGTCESLYNSLTDEQKEYIEIADNPEFLREGFAIHDFLHPDKVIIGSMNENSLANELLPDLYYPILTNSSKLIKLNLFSAEISKYFNNDMLGTKIAKVNEYRTICGDKVSDEDFTNLMNALGLDNRISPKFLQSSAGFGGSCFPKDILALSDYSKDNNCDTPLLYTTLESNRKRTEYCANKIFDIIKNNNEFKNILVLGVAFKAGTDDIRYSTAVDIIRHIVDKNIEYKLDKNIVIHDPEAIDNFIEQTDLRYKDYVHPLCIKDKSILVTEIQNSDLVIVLTEWQLYKDALETMKVFANQPTYIDTRHIVSKELNPISI